MATATAFVRRNRAVTAGIAAVAVAVAAWLAFGYFGVQTLFTDKTVQESGPVFDSGAGGDAAAPAAGAGPGSPPAGSGVATLATGSFADRSHPTSGAVSVLGDGSGQRFLRIEGLQTDNGPDLNVYLSAAPPDAPASALDGDFVDLGDLKGNRGDQNYEIPASVDLSRYRTVVIWCVRFSVAFGTAGLSPA